MLQVELLPLIKQFVRAAILQHLQKQLHQPEAEL
jgi:hypothetical protein